MTPPDETPSPPHDWNTSPLRRRPIDVADTTLCDGLHSPSVTHPSSVDQRRLLALMNDLGLRSACLGHPGGGARQFAGALDLSRELMRGQWPIDASCVARATVKDLAAALDVRERSGLDLEVAIALPVSPVRLEAEGIAMDRLHEAAESAVGFAVRAGARVVGVLEDASRTPPAILAVLIHHLVALGAGAIRICDSAGHATPDGTQHLLRFVADQLQRRRGDGRAIRIDWQGNDDRGLALANALAAVDVGADRVLASALGVGARSGTVPLEVLLTNLRLTNRWPHTLGALMEYSESAAAAFGIAIPPAHAVVGANAFRSGTGSHATALVKALRSGDRTLADAVTSAVPASLVGAEHRVDVSPVSGLSNVRWWLSEHGYDPSDLVLTRELLLSVKQTQRVATDDELHSLTDSLLSSRVARM